MSFQILSQILENSDVNDRFCMKLEIHAGSIDPMYVTSDLVRNLIYVPLNNS